MPRVFEPWVGDEYWSSGITGAKVLLLGESHYGEESPTQGMATKDVVNRHVSGFRQRFLTVTQKMVDPALDGRLPKASERVAFWRKVAFYNFVQRFVSGGPRVPPTGAMWAEAAEPFVETIKELNPDLVVVLGTSLADHLPVGRPKLREVLVPHPASFGFKALQWREVIQHQLREVTHCSGSGQR